MQAGVIDGKPDFQMDEEALISPNSEEIEELLAENHARLMWRMSTGTKRND